MSPRLIKAINKALAYSSELAFYENGEGYIMELDKAMQELQEAFDEEKKEQQSPTTSLQPEVVSGQAQSAGEACEKES